MGGRGWSVVLSLIIMPPNNKACYVTATVSCSNYMYICVCVPQSLS